jgi:hypothetical protein
VIEKKNRNSGLPATTSQPRPGDFPLGSAQSRAAARAAISARQPQLSQYDVECLAIESLSHHLQGTAWPKAMEKVPAWQHGRELIKSSPDFPKWLEAMRQFGARKFGPCPFASIAFIDAYGRQPSAGDVLKYMDLKQPAVTAEDVNELRSIWERRVPEYVVKSGQRTFEGYEPVWNEVPQFRWAWVEDEALGSQCRWCNVERTWAQGTEISELQPTIQSVLFCEDGTVKPPKANP